MRERFKTFTVLIANINRNIRRIKTEVMEEYDLKCPHVSCLYYLYVKGPLTAKELCEICNEDKGAISRSVDYLISESIIENNTEGKRYKSLLKLTEKGKEVGAYVAEKINEVLDVASVGITDEERTIMYTTLTRINDNLQGAGKNNKRKK